MMAYSLRIRVVYVTFASDTSGEFRLFNCHHVLVSSTHPVCYSHLYAIRTCMLFAPEVVVCIMKCRIESANEKRDKGRNFIYLIVNDLT